MRDGVNSKTCSLNDTRILVVMPSIPVYGMERANLQIMKMLRQKGAGVLFITEQDRGDRLRQEVERNGCDWRNIVAGEIDRTYVSLLNSIKTVFNIFSASIDINKIYKEYDPTHIHITDLKHLIRSFITVTTTKKTVVFRLPNPPNLRLKGTRGMISKFIWRYYVAKFVDEIVCNSAHSAKELEAVGIRHDNIKIIYNSVPERLIMNDSDFSFISRKRFNVVYIGRMTYDKGVEDIFHTAKRLIEEYDDIDFYFAGDYKRKSSNYVNLERQIEDDNLLERIHLLGEVEDVFGLLSRCHLHLCPSKFEQESFPNVVLEAKSQAVPSVVYPNAGLTEAIRHLNDGYVCEDKTTDELYKGIKYFKDDSPALKKCGKEAKKSLDRFSNQKVLEQWCEVYC